MTSFTKAHARGRNMRGYTNIESVGAEIIGLKAIHKRNDGLVYEILDAFF